jgi:hypothetical protein
VWSWMKRACQRALLANVASCNDPPPRPLDKSSSSASVSRERLRSVICLRSTFFASTRHGMALWRIDALV